MPDARKSVTPTGARGSPAGDPLEVSADGRASDELDPMSWTRPLEYGRLSWPEVARAVEEERTPIVPVATLEDHGPHLPIDTDVTIVEAICRGAVEQLDDAAVLVPSVTHGYSPHHMDFPGTLTIDWDTFCRYCTDVATSLVRHGFRRVLLVNGHGSNQPLVEMAARLTMVAEPGSLVGAAFYLTGPESAAVLREQRDSTIGGMAHACELETSLYLHIAPEHVDMEAAVDERSYPATEHAWLDWSDGPLKVMPAWSSFSESGVQGDATLATPEKGKAFFEVAVAEVASFVKELAGMPLPEGRNHHGS
jgi:creatinine amidohydrolase